MTAAPPEALRLLGLAARAGAVLPGTERVREAVRGGRVAFVIVAADLGPTSEDKLVPLLKSRGVPFVVAYDRARLGNAVGRAPLAAVGITDASLAARVAGLIRPTE